jgi:hypothetical protein
MFRRRVLVVGLRFLKVNTSSDLVGTFDAEINGEAVVDVGGVVGEDFVFSSAKGILFFIRTCIEFDPISDKRSVTSNFKSASNKNN